MVQMKDAGNSITARREGEFAYIQDNRVLFFETNMPSYAALENELKEEQQKGKDCWDQPEMNKYKVGGNVMAGHE